MIINNKPISCIFHASLNLTRVVVYSKDLFKYPKKVLEEKLTNQRVVSIKRSKNKIKGVLTLIPSLIVSFQARVLPSTLRVAWVHLPVCPYLPLPCKCYHCFLGTWVKTADGKPVAYLTRDDSECTADSPKCINCNGPHPASSKRCDRYLFDKKMVSLKTIDK